MNYIISERNAIFLDFKRALNTIDRYIMLKKLYMYGIRQIELEWFKSLLENRKQSTKLNNTVSEEAINNFGVTQGSILGVLLFILYINYMLKILERCKVVLYADDTLIYKMAKSDRECQSNIKCDVRKINEWLKMNKLILNGNKTKIMEMNMNSGEVLKINDLGFVIDKKKKN